MKKLLRKLYISCKEIAAIDLIITSLILVLVVVITTPNFSIAGSDAGTNNSIGRGGHSYTQIVEPYFHVENNSGFESYSNTIRGK